MEANTHNCACKFNNDVCVEPCCYHADMEEKMKNVCAEMDRAATDAARSWNKLMEITRLHQANNFPIIQFFQQDWIPGFAAFIDDGMELKPDSRPFCVLNVGSLITMHRAGDVDAREIPYIVAETMMHEIMHVIEKWAGVEFSEEKVELLLEKYRHYAESQNEKSSD